MSENKKILITLGDVGGIGPEIAIKALNSIDIKSEDICIVGSKEIFYKTAVELGLHVPKISEIIDIPFDLSKLKIGEPTKENGKHSMLCLIKCCDLVKKGFARAIVTAPVSKKSINMAGYNYSGQTEILKKFLGAGFLDKNKDVQTPKKYQLFKGNIKKVFSKLNNSKKLYGPEMLFVAKDLRVLLLTRHIKLCEVSQNLCAEKILASIIILKYSLENDFNIKNPKIALCGLNPHAGENGVFGLEEEYFFTPAIKQLREKYSIDIEGPFSADTLWVKAARAFNNNKKLPYDAYVSCYHDQGLIPVKMLAMETAVNTTINLPVIRTSPCHGTAFDLVGKNKADFQSMFEAIKLADNISSKSFNMPKNKAEKI